jgi:hypothetical protein
MTEVAAFTAWLGAAMIALSDGRRGIVLGLSRCTPALAVLVWPGGQPLAADAVLLGGAVAAGRRARTGREGWAMMPPRSTPRLVLSIAGGLVALWIATTVMTSASVELRFAVLSVLGIMGARILAETEPAALLTALAALALTVAVASGLADAAPGPALYMAAAVIAVGVSFVRLTTTDVA